MSSNSIMEEPAIRQGVYVTAAYVLVFYACVIGQASAKVKISSSYRARGERVSPMSVRQYPSVCATGTAVVWGACCARVLWRHR